MQFLGVSTKIMLNKLENSFLQNERDVGMADIMKNKLLHNSSLHLSVTKVENKNLDGMGYAVSQLTQPLVSFLFHDICHPYIPFEIFFPTLCNSTEIKLYAI